MVAASELRTFHCDECRYKVKARYGDTQSLFKHFLCRHSQLSTADKLCCDQCNMTTFCATVLWRHISQRHMGMGLDVDMLVVCNDCDTGSKFVKQKYFVHFLRRHSHFRFTFDCAECDFAGKNKHSIIEHISRAHLLTSAARRCEKCGKICAGKTNLQRHKKTAHSQVDVCDECGVGFLSADKRSLLLHVAAVHQTVSKKTAVCDQCHFQCHSRNTKDLWRHIYSHHISQDVNDQVMCDACDKPIGKTYLFNHIRIHHWRLAPTYQCDVCLVENKDKSTIARHIHYNHLPLRRLVCDICLAVYYKTKGLQWHRRTTHEGFRVVCAQCNRSFTSKASLMSHAIGHL